MPNTITELHTVDLTTFDYIFKENADIHLKRIDGLVRCNVYRPKSEGARFPVLVTYGPYGKDVHYEFFHPASYIDVPQEHHSSHSAWETPDPAFWTKQGYAIVRADEVGTGQSPGFLDVISANTAKAFADVIEWAASQPWSNGKVGLLGISYYALTQWMVAALQPAGLTCMIPWEGFSDAYRDSNRHGGILSNTFFDAWYKRQVLSNQYGLPGRAARNWGKDTLEGDLSEEELITNRRDISKALAQSHYLDQEHFRSGVYDLNDVQVPFLSVANWGGNLLHLRGNVEGFKNASSEKKWLRFITGRHDLPFYEPEFVELQKSFLDAFLKGEDRAGWLTGGVPPVEITLRKGDVGYNDSKAEKGYETRTEQEWPISRTQYTKFHLSADHSLSQTQPAGVVQPATLSYEAPSDLKNPEVVHFKTAPFTKEVEFTGHVVLHLNISLTPDQTSDVVPSEIDLFVTLRHLDPKGKEIFYTGTVGDPIPIAKGWIRVSLRKMADENPHHKPWQPWREYRSVDVLPVTSGEVYPVDIEIWPTNVVVSPGNQLVLEVASGDAQGVGIFEHNSEADRPREKLLGLNNIHFGPDCENWLLMPVIPAKEV